MKGMNGKGDEMAMEEKFNCFKCGSVDAARITTVNDGTVKIVRFSGIERGEFNWIGFRSKVVCFYCGGPLEGAALDELEDYLSKACAWSTAKKKAIGK